MDRGERAPRVDASDPEQIKAKRDEQVERLSSQIRSQQDSQKTPATQVLTGTIYICGGTCDGTHCDAH